MHQSEAHRFDSEEAFSALVGTEPQITFVINTAHAE